MPPPQGWGCQRQHRERCNHELCKKHRQTPGLGAVYPGRGGCASSHSSTCTQRGPSELSEVAEAMQGLAVAEQGGTARARRCHRCLHKVPLPSATHPSCDRRAGQNCPSSNPSQGRRSHSFWNQHPQNCQPSLLPPAQRLGEAPVSLQHIHTLKAPKRCQELVWNCRVSVPLTAPPKFIRSRSRNGFCCAAGRATPASRDRGKPHGEHHRKLQSTRVSG